MNPLIEQLDAQIAILESELPALKSMDKTLWEKYRALTDQQRELGWAENRSKLDATEVRLAIIKGMRGTLLHDAEKDCENA